MWNDSRIKIGADPEFLLLKNDSTSTINIDYQHTLAKHGSIGTDHGGRCGELRPMPGDSKEVTENLRKLILKVKEKFNSHKMISGGGTLHGQSIGGHIHISGVNFEYNTFNSIKNSICKNNNTHFQLINALDYFIGRRLAKVQGGKRPTKTYGRPLDVRHQTWGFEYRTPPSWLSDPIITESTLAISYLIANIWSQKHDYFALLTKKIASKNDYSILLPNFVPESDKNYFRTQISNFKSIVFSKEYDMSQIDCFKSWDIQEVEQVKPVKLSITLQKCIVKYSISDSTGTSETILKTCQFVVPEIKIINYSGTYSQMHLNGKRKRFKINTIYISKSLRPFLKIKRELNIKVRFIETSSVDSNNYFLFSDSINQSKLFESIKFILSNCLKVK
jgi:hypothetical protein